VIRRLSFRIKKPEIQMTAKTFFAWVERFYIGLQIASFGIAFVLLFFFGQGMGTRLNLTILILIVFSSIGVYKYLAPRGSIAPTGDDEAVPLKKSLLLALVISFIVSRVSSGVALAFCFLAVIRII